MKYPLCVLFLVFFAGNLFADENDELIKNEFNKIRVVANIPNARLELINSPGVSSKAHKDGRVVINVLQIKNLLAKVKSAHRVNVVRLVVAHELAHQMQYQHNVVSKSQILNECQADVIAGYLCLYLGFREKLMSGAVDKNGVVSTKAIEELEDVSKDSMESIFLLGDEYSTTHPSREQRRRAFRSGMMFSFLQLTDDVIKAQVPEIQKQPAKVQFKKYAQLLNYISQDNILSWSGREANKIIHHQTDNCKDIVVYNQWTWDPSKDNPFLTYSQTIKNLGKKKLRISYANQIVYAARDDAQNSLYWDLQASEYSTIILGPGTARTLNNKLEWQASTDRMPKFIGLGFPGSLYTCGSIDNNGTTIAPEVFSLSTIDEDITDINALDVVFNQQKDLSKFISGIGTCSTDSCNYIDYPSKVKIGTAETKLVYNRKDDDLHMEILLYDGTKKDEAERKHKVIIEDLKDVLPSSAFGGEEKIMNSRYRSIFNNNKVEIGDIYIKHSRGTYTVGINVYSEKGLGL